MLEALALPQWTAGAQLGGAEAEAELPLLAGALVRALVLVAHVFFSMCYFKL